MNLNEAQTLAKAAMRAHGLYGWTFRFNRSKGTLGLCYHTQRRIELSTLLTQHGTREQVVQTIGHEIAHALVGHEAGHGSVWKAQMRSMGLTPDRCGEVNETQKIVLRDAAKYVLTCAVDGRHVGNMDRIVKSRRSSKTGTIRRYKGHACRCHGKSVLYNGLGWDSIS